MEEQLAHTDDSSHYEISLTAGQAFMAFVLLLLSLAASFAFGLMIGKGQADERLVVRKETPVVTEGSVLPPKSKGEIVELGVSDDEFQESDPATDTAATTSSAGAATATAAAAATETAAAPEPATTTASAEPVVIREAAPSPPAAVAHGSPATQYKVPPPPAKLHVTTYAQLLSTTDQKTAEALAAKLIDRGFLNAYVERGSTDKGPVYRVRVRFASETEARASETKLKEFSNDVWITTR